MNNEMYQDIKNALEKLAVKVPQSWDILVQERWKIAMSKLIAGDIFAFVFILIGLILLRFGIKKDYEYVTFVGGLSLGLGILMLFVFTFSNIDCVAGPNFVTFRELIK